MSGMPLLAPGARIALATTATASGVLALLALKPHATAPPAAAPAPQGAAQNPAAGANPQPTATGGAQGTQGTQGTRTVKGDTFQTRYGPVQVRITLTGGRLTGVDVLRAPQGNGRDQEITSFSVPQLTQEALAAQSAQIDSVSGATYTSEGYVRSLQSALDKARGG
ncbi:FMN-binding protein [Streptomyces sp. NRRL F-5123]|uniref:FMN-binding protein n=1 Tax=Streptomyces sp. NRRL F-5123 TaxID=1463856 RepID=UPI0004E26411|nr:FMN-binding protein [Streptomyces sp. NRRL F-5123]